MLNRPTLKAGTLHQRALLGKGPAFGLVDRWLGWPMDQRIAVFFLLAYQPAIPTSGALGTALATPHTDLNRHRQRCHFCSPSVCDGHVSPGQRNSQTCFQ